MYFTLIYSAYVQPNLDVDYYSRVEDKKGDLQSCRLYCKVKHISKSNGTDSATPPINDPHVTWERMKKNSNKTEYYPLQDILYWLYHEELFFMGSLRYRCSSETEERNIFDCGINITYCSPKYFGDYMCNVEDLDNGERVDQYVQLKKKIDDKTKCHMPQADNITVELVPLASGMNGMSGINVSWDYVEKPRGSFYCPTSRQWQVRSFNSTTHISFEDGKEPAENKFKSVEFLNTTHKRDTYFVFEVNNTLLNENYFQFQIINSRQKQLATAIYERVVQKFNSSVYTFKNQRKCNTSIAQH